MNGYCKSAARVVPRVTLNQNGYGERERELAEFCFFFIRLIESLSRQASSSLAQDSPELHWQGRPKPRPASEATPCPHAFTHRQSAQAATKAARKNPLHYVLSGHTVGNNRAPMRRTFPHCTSFRYASHDPGWSAAISRILVVLDVACSPVATRAPYRLPIRVFNVRTAAMRLSWDSCFHRCSCCCRCSCSCLWHSRRCCCWLSSASHPTLRPENDLALQAGNLLLFQSIANFSKLELIICVKVLEDSLRERVFHETISLFRRIFEFRHTIRGVAAVKLRQLSDQIFDRWSGRCRQGQALGNPLKIQLRQKI